MASVWRKRVIHCYTEHENKMLEKNVYRNFWPKFNNFMGFERTLKFMCWPWGVIYRLWYDYESFPRFVDDPKRVYIAIKDQKKIWWKKVFIEIFDPNLAFFRDIWRSLRPSGLVSYAYHWLKYNFRSFPRSLDDEKHVRIELMNIKNFCWKKIFIEISDRTLTVLKWLWRSLKYLCFLFGVYYCLKYDSAGHSLQEM